MSNEEHGTEASSPANQEADTWEGPVPNNEAPDPGPMTGQPTSPGAGPATPPWEAPTGQGTWPGGRAIPGFADSGPPTVPAPGSGAIPMPPAPGTGLSPATPGGGHLPSPAGTEAAPAPGAAPGVNPEASAAAGVAGGVAQAPSWAQPNEPPPWAGGHQPGTPGPQGPWGGHPGWAPPGPPGSGGQYPGYGAYGPGTWAGAGGGGGQWAHGAPAWPSARSDSKQRARRLAAGLVVGGVVVAAVVGGFVGHAIWQPSATTNSAFVLPPSGSSSPGAGSGGSGPSSASAASIAQKVDPGLVDINTIINYGEIEGAGTGMVLTPNGEILTNNHVIEGATKISVTDIGNGKTYGATVVGYDRTQDVAILQLTGASGLQTVSLGNSSKVSNGDSVVVIGNAGGTGGTPSYSGGTITGTNQSVTASDQATGTTEQLTGMLQTNADIISGDSGGPMVNTSGQVIGMDTASSSGFQFQSTGNQGFAIPINTAVSIAKTIESGVSSSTVHIGPTAFLGVSVQPSSSSGGNGGFGGFGNGLGGGSTSPVNGAQIVGTVANGPAAQAGLSAGDVITSVAGHSVTSDNSLTNVMINDVKPNQTVQVQYTTPSGQQASVTMTLASGPPQ